jgi:Ca2+-binding RTX toxin-like protein
MIRTRIDVLTLPSDVEFKYVSFTGMANQVIGVLDDLYPASQVYPLNQSSVVFFDTAHPTAQLHAMAAAYLVDQLSGTSSGDVLSLKSADYTLNGGIGVKGEVDSVVLSLAGNTTYTLNMLGLSSLGGNFSMLEDPLVKVVGPSGVLVASNDDAGVGLDASLTFTTGTTGDYVVQLAGVGSMTGTYRFQADGTATGNNTYIVSHSSAIILERAGEGTDTVLASLSYTLQAEVSIEQLRTISDAGSAAINLTGNNIVQSIIGNAGNNIIDGKGGSDSLWGLGGNDTFAFDTALGPGNVDRIYDFDPATDSIRLDDAFFRGLSLGGLSQGAFASGSAATQADDRIIYDSTTGKLFFDPDGIGGAAQIQFATLNPGLGLTSADFFVV